MKRNLKLSLLTSLSLIANVFAAGTPESHVLNPDPTFTQHAGVPCDRTAAVATATWNPKTAYCLMTPECKRGDEEAYGIVEEVQRGFIKTVMQVFSAAKIQASKAWHMTLFTDNALGKYQPGTLDSATKMLVDTVKPFWADLYDVYLFVVYEEGGVKKYMSFLPDAPRQSVSLENLRAKGLDALPISELASFAPTATCGKKILRSHLVVRVGTDGLIPFMVSSLSQAYEQSGLGKIEPFIESPIGHVTLASMQTGTFMAPDKAQAVIDALNKARQTLRGPNNDQKPSFWFRDIRLSVVDPAQGGQNAKVILSGDLR